MDAPRIRPFRFDVNVASAASPTGEELADLFERGSLGQEADRRAPCVAAIAAGGVHRIDASREHFGNRDRAKFGLCGH